MKKTVFFVLLVGFLCLAGCGLLPITDEQIDAASKGTGQAVERLVRPAVDLLVPGLGGLAGVIGAAVTLGTRAGLKALQRKKEDKIREIAREEK